MCNLLIPLCPFVLHSVATSSSAAAYNSTPGSMVDAKILYAYLSKRSYEPSGTAVPSTSHKPTPLVLPSLKLYKRITWHTCSCFFTSVTVLHPRPGPGRPSFGTSGWYCSRCSKAAKVLRPMRSGGPTDRDSREDPWFNVCYFLGLSSMTATGGLARVSELEASETTLISQQDRQQIQPDRGIETARVNGRTYIRYPTDLTIEQDEFQHPPSQTSSRAGHYQDDLSSYLRNTYGK
jgi:hypothetical protein